MTARQLKDPRAFGFEDKVELGYSTRPISMPDEVSVFERSDGPEPPYFLVEKVKKRYSPEVFHPDNRLIEYFISRGLTREEAKAALPKAERMLSTLTREFKEAGAMTKLERSSNDGASVTLPDAAPELFETARGRPKKGKDIVSFLRRVWKDPWIDAGVLTRTELGRLDPAAYSALNSHLRHSDLPDDLKIPTLSEDFNSIIPPELAIFIGNSDEKMLRAIRAIAERELKHVR